MQIFFVCLESFQLCMSISKGPWIPLEPNTLGGCNNPAPWVHPNGTIFIVCKDLLLRSEDSISGPWSQVSQFTHDGGPYGSYEDPYLYASYPLLLSRQYPHRPSLCTF